MIIEVVEQISTCVQFQPKNTWETSAEKTKLSTHWAAQVEMRYYYSFVSTQKDYQRVHDPRYNSTLAVQAGVWYCF